MTHVFKDVFDITEICVEDKMFPLLASNFLYFFSNNLFEQVLYKCTQIKNYQVKRIQRFLKNKYFKMEKWKKKHIKVVAD